MHPKTRHTHPRMRNVRGCVLPLTPGGKINLDKMHADDRMKGLIGDYWCLRANTVQIPLTVR